MLGVTSLTSFVSRWTYATNVHRATTVKTRCSIEIGFSSGFISGSNPAVLTYYVLLMSLKETHSRSKYFCVVEHARIRSPLEIF